MNIRSPKKRSYVLLQRPPIALAGPDGEPCWIHAFCEADHRCNLILLGKKNDGRCWVVYRFLGPERAIWEIMLYEHGIPLPIGWRTRLFDHLVLKGQALEIFESRGR